MIILIGILFFSILIAFIDAGSDAVLNGNRESGMFASIFFACLVILGLSIVTSL
jgi:hypothetical protein